MIKNRIQKTVWMVILFAIITGCQAVNTDNIIPVTGSTAANPLVAIIPDALLQESWQALNQMEATITLWDGRTITGKDLAVYLLQNGIPVVWNSDGRCGGGSCSRLYCSSEGRCEYNDGQPGIDPIFINANARTKGSGQVTRLAAELAHEAFHRMQPFGAEEVSQLEEYWAFFITAQVTGSSWPNFSGCDPLDQELLTHWFTMHSLRGYLELKAYPSEYQQYGKGRVTGEMAQAKPSKRLEQK